MKVSELIKKLEVIKDDHGDIEVTTTGSLLDDGYCSGGGCMKDVFESTVESLIVHNDSSNLGHRVRLYWQMP